MKTLVVRFVLMFVVMAVVAGCGGGGGGASYPAGKISPVSYTATPGEAGWFAYYDETGQQLNDGLFGQAWVLQNQTDANPWVGWANKQVDAQFIFPRDFQFNQIKLYTAKHSSASIYIPSDIEILYMKKDGSWISLGKNYYDDTLYQDNNMITLTIDFPKTVTSSIKIRLTPSGKWILIDEVEFYNQDTNTN